MSILNKIKAGKKNYKLIDFPGTDEKVAIVVLSSEMTTQCKLKADSYIEANKIKDETFQDIVLQQYLAYEFLRDKDDITKRITGSFDELKESLDGTELAFLVMQYNMFMQEISPFLGSVTDEQLEALKKTLEKMTLNDLSGESLVALRNFLMSLV